MIEPKNEEIFLKNMQDVAIICTFTTSK